MTQTTTREQHAIKIVFETDRELTTKEINQLIDRLLLEIEEPVVRIEDETNLSMHADADYTTSNIQHAYENLTMVPDAERIVGSINQHPASK